MAPPVSGLWAATNANARDYSGALKWGTGASNIYGVFGAGPPVGITGREDGPGVITPVGPATGNYDVPPVLLSPEMYGYTMEDVPVTTDYEYMEGVPSPAASPETYRGDPGLYPPPSWQARPNGPSGGFFRTLTQPGLLRRGTKPTSYPTETVTEGWDNKLTGEVLTAETSAPGQYERQTSMQQVDPPLGRNNAAAVLRGTDDPRDNIRTRLTGMKIKPWSEGQRLEDMFPYQQDLMLRPWRYRLAATGRENWLTANEFNSMTSIQRDPPSEPDTGNHESEGNTGTENFGYTNEDWYA